MKNPLILLCMAISLCGHAMAAGESETSPSAEKQKLTDYVLSNTSGDFLDLSAIANNQTLMTANGIQTIVPLGADLTPGTELNKYYYAFDETAANELKIGAKQTNGTDALTTCPAFVSSSFSGKVAEFMEKTATGFVISALGGIYFTDAANGSTNMVCPIPNQALSQITPTHGACIYPSLVTISTENNEYTETVTTVTATKAADKIPAYCALGSDTYGAFVIVQYDYMVGSNNWNFQIKCSSDGKVACHIKKIDTVGLAANNQNYRLALGAKRDQETLLLGGMLPTTINTVNDFEKQGAPWNISQYQCLDKRILSLMPKGGKVTFSQAYHSADITLSLSAQTQRAVQTGSLLVLWSERRISTFTTEPKTKEDNYKPGDQINGATVIYNDSPTDINIPLNQSNLKPNKDYFLYVLLGTANENTVTYSSTPILSETIRTLTVLPPVAIKAGTPTGNKIPFTIEQPGIDLDMVVFKSFSTSTMSPTGQLTAGEKYENWQEDYFGDRYLVNSGTVLELLPAGSTQFEVECTPGEMAYILVYSILDGQTANPVYSNKYAVAPLYSPATRLPLSYTFTNGDDDPNVSDTLMPMLPPGMSTDMAVDPNHPYIRTSAFAIQPESYFNRDNWYLASIFAGEFDGNKLTSHWPNVILPAFSGVEKVQATIFARLYQSGMVQGQIDNHNWAASDSIRIEYKLNDGEWLPAGLFTIANKPDKDNNNLYPLTVTFECQKSDVVSLRYSYRFAKPTESSVYNALSGYKIIEPRDCKVPEDITLVFAQSTDKQIQLNWTDNNTVPAGQYRVSYQKYVASVSNGDMGGDIMPRAAEDGEGANESEEGDVWQTLSVNKTEATLRNLEANTTYSIKVQAVCGAEDSSSVSPEIRVNTFVKLPYVENMAFEDWDFGTNDYAKKPNVKVYTGTPGKLQEEDYESDQVMTWNATQCAAVRIDQEADATALAVSCFMENAWLVTPGLYHKSNEEFPKALKFKIETFERVVTPASQIVAEYGIDLEDPDLRLYVIASEDGQFRLADTVAVYDHNALKATENTETATPREFSIDMSAYKTPVQIAFYFYNPNPIDMAGDGDPRELCLELSDLSFAYEGDPCFKVENPAFTATTADALSLTWESDEVLGYSLMWKTEEAADFTRKDSAFVEEPRYTIEGLVENTTYIVKIVAHCDAERTSAPVRLMNMTAEGCHTPQDFTVSDVTATGATFSSTTDQTQARRLVYVTPQAGGEPQIFVQSGDQLVVTDVFTAKTAYVATSAAVCGNDTSAMSAEQAFTTLESLSNEDVLKTDFIVSTQNGQLYIRNLKGYTIKEIDVYGLTGQLIHRFAPNSREDLMLSIDARSAILFVRLSTENGLAVYKVYMK